MSPSSPLPRTWFDYDSPLQLTVMRCELSHLLRLTTIACWLYVSTAVTYVLVTDFVWFLWCSSSMWNSLQIWRVVDYSPSHISFNPDAQHNCHRFLRSTSEVSWLSQLSPTLWLPRIQILPTETETVLLLYMTCSFLSHLQLLKEKPDSSKMNHQC